MVTCCFVACQTTGAAKQLIATEEPEDIISSSSTRVVHWNRLAIALTTEVIRESSICIAIKIRMKQEESYYSDTFAGYCDTFWQNTMVIALSG